MRLTRIYQENTLHENLEIELSPDCCHRLLHVLRIKTGDDLILFDGSGFDFEAKITTIKKKKIFASVSSKKPIHNESNLHIHLAQALAKGDKVDFILQKAVELGANEITLLNTERSNVNITPERMEKRWQHWQNILIHACEQSGRSLLPHLHRCEYLEKWMPQQENSCKLVLDPNARTTLSAITKSNDNNFILLIGPEGGLSNIEIQLAIKHAFQTVKLGSRILRTETAALASISALQTLFGDFQ